MDREKLARTEQVFKAALPRQAGKPVVPREKLVKTEQVFKGRGMKVRVDTVLVNGGRSTTREVVERGRAVVILPVDNNGDILLIRQYRYSISSELLELPAGMIEPGETPSDCARRELQEETGFAPGELKEITGWWVAPGFCDEYMHFFVARDLTPSRLYADDTDGIRLAPMKLDECLGLIRKGQLGDGKSIAALLIYALNEIET
ncbi:MAG: NUDIX hydrolase [Chloroflexi bacterium]|nr:NUDIX hydrolase [Chloroflexota bacterium]